MIRRRSLLNIFGLLPLFAASASAGTVAAVQPRYATIKKAMAALGERFQQVSSEQFVKDALARDMPLFKAPTGERFVSLCSGGIKDEGESAPALCADAATAERLWAEAVMEYARERRGTLYWRQEPTLEMQAEIVGGNVRETYFVYSRLLISERRADQEFSMPLDERQTLLAEARHTRAA